MSSQPSQTSPTKFSIKQSSIALSNTPSKTPSNTPSSSSNAKHFFPVGKQANKLVSKALKASSNPVETIQKFQKVHSLHSYLSKAFGTTSINVSHDEHDINIISGKKGGASSRRVTRGDVQQQTTMELEGVLIEPFQPDSVLTFLNHLGISRYDIHKKICDALRTKLEHEIQKVNLKSTATLSTTLSATLSSTASIQNDDSEGKKILLDLLKSSWEYIHVPELRPVFITLINKLGDQTPKEVLVLLAKRDNTITATSSSSSSSSLKYAELLDQFGVPMKRLVWEADWSSVVRGDGQIIMTGGDNSDSSTTTTAPHSTATQNNDKLGTLHSPNLLADIVRDIAMSYMADPNLVKAANLAFPTSYSDRKVDTKKRRTVSSKLLSDETAITVDNGVANAGNAAAMNSTTTSILTGTLSSLMNHTTTTNEKNKVDESKSSSATNTKKAVKTHCTCMALIKLKEVMGSNPKLLSAVLNMMIAEHGLQYKKSKSTSKHSNANNSLNIRSSTTILRGSSYLHCTLVADILLSYGQLPKQYEFVHILAKVLDDSVNKGLVSDHAIAQIQGCLRSIFQPSSSEKDNDKNVKSNNGGDNNNKVKSKSDTNPNNPERSAADRQFELKLLRKIIKLAVGKMRENDNQRCFLNPVTDEIAPGYSKVITKPICISTIEKKAIDLHYTSLKKFENDVQLMFNNCIRYNIGPGGQWFRGEARRQQKKWKETILKPSKEMYHLEMDKRKSTDSTQPEKVINDAERIRAQQQELLKQLAEKRKVGDKRKHKDISKKDNETISDLVAEDVNPLPKSRNKKRKNDVDFPSMPALAAMLLSDPLVVRLLIFKVLNAMRNDILKASDIPSNHKTVPSIMQLLHLIQISTQLCAKKGKIYGIPDAGLTKSAETDDEDDSIISESYLTLRKFSPLIAKLMLEAEIDKRFSVGGDFHSHLSSTRLAHKTEEWDGSSSSSSVLLPLVQGSLIPLLMPKASNEMALLTQLPRFFTAIDALSGGEMLNEKQFYISLIQIILKHKSKLPHSVRDLIVKRWLKWFHSTNGSSIMLAPVHLYFIKMLNEWSLLGNLILPRDSLLAFSEDAVKAAEENENDGKKFAQYWVDDALGELKVEYERMLKNIPVDRRLKWEKAVGLNQTKKIEVDK